MNVTPPDFLPEAALCESERQLKLALRAGRMGLWHIDLATSRAVWDEQVHRIHGWEPNTFPGTWEAFCSRVHPEDLPKVKEASRTCNEKRRNFTVQFRVIWPDGSVHWIEDHGILDLGLAGEPTSVTGLSVDITARRQTQTQLQTAKEDAERANEAMHGAVERLCNAAGAAAVLETLGLEAIRVTGADGCLVLRRAGDAAGKGFEVAAMFEGGANARGALAASFLAHHRDASRRDPGGWFARMRDKEFVACHVEEATHGFPEAAIYHRAHGHRRLWNVPFRFDGEVTGALQLAFRADRAADGLVVQTLETLAMQASIALRLHRKIDATRETAVARERAQSAQAYAAELVRTNEAMRRGSEAMAAAGSDTAVMGTLLAQATIATGAAGAAVKRRTAPGASQVTLVAISQHGQVLEASDLAGLPCVAELERVSREDPAGHYAKLFAGRMQSRRCDAALAATEPCAAAYHAAHGHRLVWDYPFQEEGETAAGSRSPSPKNGP